MGVFKGRGQRDSERQKEIGIDCGCVFLPTNTDVKGESCAEECPTK